MNDTTITRRGLEILHTADPHGRPTQGGRAALARLERAGLLSRDTDTAATGHRFPYTLTPAGHQTVATTTRPTRKHSYDPTADARTPEVAAVLAHGRAIRETEALLSRLRDELDVLLDRAVPGDAPYPQGRMKLLADELHITYDWVTKRRNEGKRKRLKVAL